MRADPRLSPIARYGVRVVLLGLALFLVALPFAVLLAQILGGGPVTVWDVTLADRVHTAIVDRGLLVAVAQVFSFLGWPVWLGLLVAAAGAFLWVRTHRRRPVVFLFVTSAAGGLLNSAVKLLVARPRPDIDEPLTAALGRSFPSGHSFGSVVVYGALALLFVTLVVRTLRPVVVVGYVVLVVGIGLSRLALGVHYLSDIVAGWILGLAWLCASTALFSAWRVEEGAEPVHPMDGAEPEAIREI